VYPSGILWSALNKSIIRQRPTFTQGRGGNKIEVPASIDTQVFMGRVQERKLKAIGHVGEEIHPEGLVNRRLFVLTFNYTSSATNNTLVDVRLEDRIIFNSIEGVTRARVTSVHDAAGQGIYKTATLEWDGPTGDN